ncbi:MAG: glycoside hydrolase family 38 C-terminal domain-containing protein [Acidimicrobiales bacterium]
MARDVVIVPHTHWDREWYLPFQTFRLQLVELVDDLLELMDADPGYAHFQLDGQMAVVDDYLAIRPERGPDLRRLAAGGRLSMGPWYILMDEFLVSGETMVRDLQLGLEAAAGFGGAMPVGYLPDMFGHVAQMPQLLAQAGFGDAVVWRGVPAAVDRDAFTWVAPDGSSVRATYLLDGYGNGATLPDDAKELVAMVDRFVERFASFLPEEGPILWMNGTDHLRPQPWLGRVVAEANDAQDRYTLRVGSLADYVAAATASDTTTGERSLPRWQGELRSGARANLLMGVGSNRVDVKQAAATAERSLERVAEPLSALFLPAERWPAAFLREAWREVVRNAAHDSICACSIDEVDAAVLHRYAEATRIAEGLTDRAVGALARSFSFEGTVAVNPTARPRCGLIEVRRPGHDPIPGTQVRKLGGGDLVSDGITRADVATLVQAALDNMPELHDAEVVVDEDGVLDVRLFHDPAAATGRYRGPARDEVNLAAAEAPDAPARLTVRTPPSQKVLALAADVPGFGWARWEPAEIDELGVAPVTVDEAGGATGGPQLANGLVTVDVDPADGSFSLAGSAGLGRLVDDGDTGDTYNYNPPTGDAVVDHADAVEVRVTEAGPLRARVEVVRTYRWPSHAAGGARTGEVEVPVTTVVEVQAGSPLVRVTTELDNRARDHRLRAWFPLPERAASSRAECAFAVVERGLAAEGGPTERPLPTYPSRRFVLAGGLTVVHDGLLEYELVDLDGEPGAEETTAGALALTLLRGTGRISQGPMAYRPLPAGPTTPTPAAQLPGRHVLRYALLAGDDVAAAYAAADEAFTPLLAAKATAAGHRTDERGSALTVHGAEVSAVVREGGTLTVRVFNPSDHPTRVTIEGRHGWLVDLRGNLVDELGEAFELGPWRIATARLADDA